MSYKNVAVSGSDLDLLVQEMESWGEGLGVMVERKFGEFLPEVVLELREWRLGRSLSRCG